MSSEVQLNALTEQMVVGIIDDMFGDVGFLDPEIVNQNLMLACDGGMSRSDRAISSDLAMYLINNFGIIYMGLISNSEFRSIFTDAVDEEIGIDSLSDEEAIQIRKQMLGNEKPASKKRFVLDFSKNNTDVFDRFVKMFSDSLDMLLPYADELDELTDELDDEAKARIGFCISNFMYLIRAFAKNRTFAACVKEIIETVQSGLFSKDTADVSTGESDDAEEVPY